MLEMRDIHSYYGKSHILQGVSMTLNEGELVCLLGRNGVGKSTTLNLLGGMDQATGGSIVVDEREVGRIQGAPLGGRGGEVLRAVHLA